jgi:hypothetical protein
MHSCVFFPGAGIGQTNFEVVWGLTIVTTLEAAAVLALGVFPTITVRLWHRATRAFRATWPAELRQARLVHAEKLFRSVGAVAITARVDRVYRTRKGCLVLVELKTRAMNRTYLSDVIELSAQRLAMMSQTGEFVADHGYVLTQRADGNWAGWHRVRLMTSVELKVLARRRHELIAGKTCPAPAFSRGLCRKCAFLERCVPPTR